MQNEPVIYDEARIDELLAALKRKIIQATMKHDPMNSPHEGYAVILEELDELWEHVKKDAGRTPDAMTEALHVAVTGIRYVLDNEENCDLFHKKELASLPVEITD